MKKAESRIPTVVASRYEVIDHIGSGGMGDVYKAKDTKLKRTVALKFLSKDLTRDQEAKKRFIYEAQAASALEHQNICSIYEVDETDDGQMYISMSYCKGESLKDKIDKGPLSIKDSINIVCQISEGLRIAHESGIVHRDIKPANIIVSDNNDVKIVDFGLAKLSGSKNLTKEGNIVGTVSYMSPEQTRGEKIDNRTDIWSLGVVLYEMITGQPPFKGEYDQAIVYSILNEDQKPPSAVKENIPSWLEDIIVKMLKKNPEERYQHIADIINDLKNEEVIPQAASQSGWIKSLLDRRVLQITGLYLIITWLMTLVMDWIINQFLFSPHLSDFSLATMLSLLPTVIIISFYHGKEPKAKWRMIEKVGVPINLLILAAILFFLFRGKDLGAAQTTVVYQDEDGNQIERIIPKSEFRKSVAVFPFDNVSGDTSMVWLQNGLMFGIMFDLTQDIYLDANPGFYEQNIAEMKSAGFPAGVDLPLSYKGKIAREMYKEYFISGDFQYKNENYILNVDVHRTKGLKKIARVSMSGNDLFNLVDEITVEIKRKLGIPERYIEQCEDYPVSEIITNSVEAMRYFVLAENTMISDFDFRGARRYYEMAIRHDSSFAGGYMRLAFVYEIENKPDLESWAMEKMIEYIYKLPGKYQFLAKRAYYDHKGDKEKLFTLAKMTVELYPEDLSAREDLARHFLRRDEIDQAIKQYKIIMGGASDEGRVIQRIGSLYINRREFDQALQFFQNYAAKNPDDYRSYTGLGKTYMAMGDFDKSRENYNKAQLLETKNLEIELQLAEIEARLGAFEVAKEIYEKELRERKSPEDRQRIYGAMADNYFEQKGQIHKTIDSWANEEKEKGGQYWEIDIHNSRGYQAFLYVMIGKNDTAFKILNEMDQVLGEKYKHISASRKMHVYSFLDQADSIENCINNITWKEDNYFGKARIDEIRGQYENAAHNYKKCLEHRGYFLEEVFTPLGRTYRKMGNFSEAEEALKEALKIAPYYAPGLYEMALLYKDRGGDQEALEYLSKALDVWKDADPEYIRAQNARKQMKEWERTMINIYN